MHFINEANWVRKTHQCCSGRTAGSPTSAQSDGWTAFPSGPWEQSLQQLVLCRHRMSLLTWFIGFYFHVWLNYTESMVAPSNGVYGHSEIHNQKIFKLRFKNRQMQNILTLANLKPADKCPKLLTYYQKCWHLFVFRLIHFSQDPFSQRKLYLHSS